MPKVNFVKRARKPIPSIGVEVGDSYYWWKFGPRFPKQVSKEHPKRQQLTLSDFLKSVYDIEDQIDALQEDDTLADEVESIVESINELAEEQREKFENLPEGLQQSGTGELLEERAENLENFANELESVVIPEESEYDTTEEYNEALNSAFEEIQACSLEY